MKQNKSKSKNLLIIILGSVAILLPCIAMIVMKSWYENKLEDLQKTAFIVINKEDLSLKVYDLNGDVVENFPIGVGKNYGNKIEQGDNRTPEGVFRITDIQNASGWKHDFGDGNGEIKGAYGPWFIRLYTEPHKGIGIHGTHLPESIGTRCTEGCIRLNNEDVLKLKELVYGGLTVIILPSQEDIKANNQNKN